MRTQMLAGMLASLWIAGGAVAQLASPPITLHDLPGSLIDGHLGYAVASAGDVDGDGLGDIVVGAPGWFPQSVIGGAFVYSGLDGSQLHAFQGTTVADRFGFSVSSAGDVNGDGYDDVIVGAPDANDNGPETGKAVIYSGFDGSTIRVFLGTATNGRLGTSVSGGADVDGDGVPDQVVSASWHEDLFFSSPSGQSVTVYSGADGSVIHFLQGGSAFGYSARLAGDVNADGRADIIVGDPVFNDPNLFLGGRAWVYSGLDGSVLQVLTAQNVASRLGCSVGGAGDVDADGHADVIVGAYREFVTLPGGQMATGTARVYSGLNGSILHTIVNVPGSYGLGTSVSGAGDVDGDGYADFVVSTESFGQTNSARAVAYSGRTGAILIDERGDPRLAGASVAGSGDLTGNGRSGIVIGSHYDSNEDHGRVRVIVTLDTHPGTQEDFVLASGVGGTLTTYNIKQARAGEVFSARMTSPGGTFAPFPPVLIGQLTSSPATYPNVPGLPELQLDPTRPYVILVDGTQGPFGSLQLPAAGITTGGYVVPSGLEGMSFMLQAFSLSPLAANGIVAMSDGNEIQFVP